MKTKLTLAALASALAFSTQADVRINGFANFIGGITSSNDTLYGYDEDLGFDQESLFAIQVSGDVNDKVTATGQVIARGNQNYEAEFEWAYLTYAATDTTSISAGRLRLPLFRYSASSDVGYSYHWVTAPRAVYDVPFNNLDGVRVDYSNYAGDWEYNLQFALGTLSADFSTGSLESDNVALISAEATYDWFKVRAVAGRGKSTLTSNDIDPVLAQLESFGLSSIASQLRMADDTSEFFGVGAEIDKFDWFVSAEATSVDTDNSLFGEDKSYYVTAGLRLGQFTPSVTYEIKDNNAPLALLDQVALLPVEVQPTVGAAVAGVQMAVREDYDQLTLGLRYDYSAGLALKADISKYSDDINSDADATLVRVGVNYVF